MSQSHASALGPLGLVMAACLQFVVQASIDVVGSAGIIADVHLTARFYSRYPLCI